MKILVQQVARADASVMRFDHRDLHVRAGALAWIVTAIFVAAAFADESRNNCGSSGPSGGLLIAAAVTAGIASVLHISRRRGRRRALLFGIAVGAGIGGLLLVFATLAWVHNCAN